MILSGNGIDHGLLTLAAQYVGIPTLPVAEQYALLPAAHPRLEYVVRLVRPGLVFTIDATQYAAALSLDVFDGIEVVSAAPGHDSALRWYLWHTGGAPVGARSPRPAV